MSSEIHKQILTEIELCRWIGSAAFGDRLVYHRGYLAIDGAKPGSRLDAVHRQELDRLAKRARWAEAAGLIHLVQRRHGPDDYSYIALARRKPLPTPSVANASPSRADKALAPLAPA